jgi:hypothetical protein
MKYLKLIVFQVIVGVLLAFFYAKLTIPKLDNFKLKILDIRGSRSFQLPARGTYLLKIFGDDIPEKVYFNSNSIVHSIFRNRTKLREFYYILPPEITKKGTNKILMLPDKRCSITILNNIVTTDFGAVLFRPSVEKKPETNGMPYLLATLLFVAWGLAILYSLKFLFGLSIDIFFFKYCFSYVPCILLLTFLYKISDLLPAQLLFFERSYIGVVAFSILIFQIPALFNFIVREIVYRYHNPEPSIEPKLKAIRPLNLIYPIRKYKNSYLEFLKISSKNVSRQFLGYKAVVWFLMKDFSDKCILLFIALLFSCAILLSFNLSFIAEFLSNVAFLSLATGVIIKLIKVRSEPNENRPA